jgi:deoxyribonuclease IV
VHKIPSSELLIGAHTSAAGGVYKALLQGQEIGATTIQLFTSNQRQWKGHPISEEGVALWQKSLEETGLKKCQLFDQLRLSRSEAASQE